MRLPFYLVHRPDQVSDQDKIVDAGLNNYKQEDTSSSLGKSGRSTTTKMKIISISVLIINCQNIPIN